MDWLSVAVITILFQLEGAVSSSQDGISGSEVELIVRPGDNVTLYCDCNRLSTVTSNKVDIAWFRNCSHKFQSHLVISTYKDPQKTFDEFFENPIPRFTLLWNLSNNTYDLLIENITESDLGLYYCGTMETKMNIGLCVEKQLFYNYGHVTTRLSLESPPTISTSDVSCDCGLNWVLVVSSRTLFLVLIPAAFLIGNTYGVNKEKRKLRERSRAQSFSMSAMY